MICQLLMVDEIRAPGVNDNLAIGAGFVLK